MVVVSDQGLEKGKASKVMKMNAFGTYQPQGTFVDNALEAGIEVIPGKLPWLSNVVFNWNYLRMKFSKNVDYKELSEIGTNSDRQNATSTNYIRHRYSLGYVASVPARMFFVDAQLKLGVAHQEIELGSGSSATDTDLDETIWGTLSLLLGIRGNSNSIYWALRFAAESGLQSRLAEQEWTVSGLLQWSVPRLLKISKPKFDFRFGPFARVNYVKFLSFANASNGSDFQEIHAVLTSAGAEVGVEW